MPLLKIEGQGSHDVEEGTRLVNAIADADVDIGHRCGGQSKCTTCRVTFAEGEPEVMTRAEYDKLRDTKNLGAFRLACQIVVDRPMTVTPLMRASDKGWDDPGPRPARTVEPEAEWFSKEELRKESAS